MMDVQMFSLIGLKADETSDAVDLVAAEDREQAVVQARSFLAQHASSTKVEIWHQDELVCTIETASRRLDA